MIEQTSAEVETTEGTVRVNFSDECGAPLMSLTLDGRTSIADLAAHAPDFFLPDSEDYALYRVVPGPDGTEKVERLSPAATLNDLPGAQTGTISLRFATALRGA